MPKLIGKVFVAPPYLVVHLPREVLQLDPGVLEGLLLHVVGRGVGQELVEGDDVAGDLMTRESGGGNLGQLSA